MCLSTNHNGHAGKVKSSAFNLPLFVGGRICSVKFLNPHKLEIRTTRDLAATLLYGGSVWPERPLRRPFGGGALSVPFFYFRYFLPTFSIFISYPLRAVFKKELSFVLVGQNLFLFVFFVTVWIFFWGWVAIFLGGYCLKLAGSDLHHDGVVECPHYSATFSLKGWPRRHFPPLYRSLAHLTAQMTTESWSNVKPFLLPCFLQCAALSP